MWTIEANEVLVAGRGRKRQVMQWRQELDGALAGGLTFRDHDK